MVGASSAGIVGGMAWYMLRKLWQVAEERRDLIQNHIAHNTEAISTLAEAIRELRMALYALAGRER